MNPERQVSDVEMHWTVEIQPNGEERLVAHWVPLASAASAPVAA
ncbi:hypothetical protein ACLM5J_18810 [Nocardioides sp. Bht2]